MPFSVLNKSNEEKHAAPVRSSSTARPRRRARTARPVTATSVTQAQTAAAPSAVLPTIVSPHVSRNADRPRERTAHRAIFEHDDRHDEQGRERPGRAHEARDDAADESDALLNGAEQHPDRRGDDRPHQNRPVPPAAAASAEQTVGSPPRIRSIAPATTAAWKKMPIA